MSERRKSALERSAWSVVRTSCLIDENGITAKTFSKVKTAVEQFKAIMQQEHHITVKKAVSHE
jgi:hypothetical protein